MAIRDVYVWGVYLRKFGDAPFDLGRVAEAGDARRKSPHPARPVLSAYYGVLCDEACATRGWLGAVRFVPPSEGVMAGAMGSCASPLNLCLRRGGQPKRDRLGVPSDEGSYSIRTARRAFALCRAVVCAESLLDGDKVPRLRRVA